jgi:hypothetical protein
MTFEINNFADLRNAVEEFVLADDGNDSLTMVFIDAEKNMHRVVLDDDSVTFEEADERGSKKA